MSQILALYDSETGSLNKAVNPSEILSAAVILVDMNTLEEVPDSRRVWYMHPCMPHLLDPVSVQINGYTYEKWEAKGTVTHKQFLSELLPFVKGAILFAQNIAFDKAFLERALRAQELEWTGHYHNYDLSSVGLPLVWLGEIKKLNLQSLCDFYGITRHDPHDAFGDTLDMLEVLRAHRKFFVSSMVYPKA